MITGGRKIVGGLAMLVVLLGLGLAAKSASVTRWDLSIDQKVASGRDSALTTLAKAATDVAQSSVGVALAVLIPVVLWLLRRRTDAVRSLLVMGGSLAVAYAAKAVVHEHRPPTKLWVIPPDNAQSFPSGHTTVAAALALTLVLAVRGRARIPVALAGLAFTVGVAFARVYLGVHYPLDVTGGALSAVSAALLVCGVLELPQARRRLEALDAVGGRRRARHAAPVGR